MRAEKAIVHQEDKPFLLGQRERDERGSYVTYKKFTSPRLGYYIPRPLPSREVRSGNFSQFLGIWNVVNIMHLQAISGVVVQ